MSMPENLGPMSLGGATATSLVDGWMITARKILAAAFIARRPPSFGAFLSPRVPDPRTNRVPELLNFSRFGLGSRSTFHLIGRTTVPSTTAWLFTRTDLEVAASG